jgi:hypothetical protein
MDDRDSPGDGDPWRESPPVGMIVLVTGFILVVAGIAVFALFGESFFSDDTARDDQVTPVRQSATTTVDVPGANLADVGDCVQVVRGGVDAELEVVDCGTPEANYQVTQELEAGDKCPGGPYAQYEVMGMGGWSLCLMLDATAGECFQGSVVNGLTPADCAGADLRVTTVLPDQADANACPAAAVPVEPLVYPEPPHTICLETPA